jgi:hypothetical protein
VLLWMLRVNCWVVGAGIILWPVTWLLLLLLLLLLLQ